jgi:hypothetical protein
MMSGGGFGVGDEKRSRLAGRPDVEDDFGGDEATLLEAFDVILLNLVPLSRSGTWTFKCEDDGGKRETIISSEVASSDLILIFSIEVEDFEEGRERRRL